VPLDLMAIPPGHDAWVLGDEPFVTIDWTGARGWLAPLESMTERVLATILFTDIVDSTGLALRLGDRAWTDRLASHEARTRETLRRYRGREIKMTGDGVLAVFDGAARALRCADALRREAGDLGLALRAAVHTGEIEVDGGEVRGVTVHEAARMLGIAEPHAIVLSETTRSLVSDLRLDLVDLGDHELRGIPGLRRLHQLR
jgi:class 3 adenylate cyclase